MIGTQACGTPVIACGRGAALEPVTAADGRQLYIPRGFAHGFCALTEVVEVVYKVDNYYSPEHDRGIIYNDPDLGITWPVAQPILSPKDVRLPRLRDGDNNFVYTPDGEG